MKQTLSVLILVIFAIGLILNQALPADAAKTSTSKKKGISKEVVDEYNNVINGLTKKIYERELYTPEDSNSLINVKLQLDQHMDEMSESTFAPLYFKLGNIFRLRGQEKDAIVCYQTILENFSDTAYGPKSRDILTQMGIEIKMPIEEDDFEEYSEEI